MRRTLLTLLLLSLVVGQFGTTVLVLFRHQDSRRRVEAVRTTTAVEKEAAGLTHLAVRLTNGLSVAPAFVRIGRDEALFEGRLYDIVSEEVRGDTLHVWGFRDDREEEATGRLAHRFEAANRDYGITAPSSSALNLQLLYSSNLSAALHRPSPNEIRFGEADVRPPTSPFGDVPHPPPRG